MLLVFLIAQMAVIVCLAFLVVRVWSETLGLLKPLLGSLLPILKMAEETPSLPLRETTNRTTMPETLLESLQREWEAQNHPSVREPVGFPAGGPAPRGLRPEDFTGTETAGTRE